MSKITKLTLLLFLAACHASIAQIKTPAASPPASVYSQVGLTDITINYFRPKVKGRQIFGEGEAFLQPYGVLWRTGANAGSKLTLSTDVTLAGTKVAAGEYLIFTIPGKDEWSFMLYNDLSLGGNVNGYKKEHEVLKTTVKPIPLSSPVEALTFEITDLSEDNTTANLMMAWSDVAIKVPVKVDFVDQVLAEIEAKTKVDPANYAQAANFYLSINKDLDKALEWMNLYLAAGDNSKQFWNVHTKARILAAMGKKKEAVATAKESMELAKNSPSGDFGYIKRNQDLMDSLK